MRHILLIWILIVVNLVKADDLFSKETEQPILQTAQTSKPTVSKRFWWHAPETYSLEDPFKRGSRPDRFRFFHQGLGKRTIETSGDLNQDDFQSKNSHTLQTIKKLVKSLVAENAVQNRHYTSGQVSADPFLVRTPTYRTLQGLNYLYGNKRAPEVFSETLYPIQAGKQQLEVTLDRSLNDKDLEQYNYDEQVDGDKIIDEYGNEIPDVNDIPVQSVESKVTKTPYDLIFASPDLKDSALYRTYETETDGSTENDDDIDNIVDDDKETANVNEERTKRWWAAEKFRRFRSPKSWNQYGGRGRHIDPALYFIGLGK